MLKIPVSIVFLLLVHCVFAQQKPITKAEQAALDSMLKEDEFYNLLKDALKPKSYFVVTATLGNNYFSVKNKRLEAAQLDSKLVFTPQVDYFHKSGLAISASGFLSSFKGKTGFYQFSITPSFATVNAKKVYATVSYTRFFRREGYEETTAPVLNDLYGNIYLKKPWLQPGISMGFSGGRSTVYHKIDTVLFAVRRMFTDTVKSTIRSFSVSLYVQHSFEFYKLLSRKDGISIVPKILLNAGSNRYTEKHYNPYSAFLKKIMERRGALGRLQYNTSFELQSAACSLDINYIIGKFGFEPQAYLDYYFPDTTDKKITCVFSFGISYSF